MQIADMSGLAKRSRFRSRPCTMIGRLGQLCALVVVLFSTAIRMPAQGDTLPAPEPAAFDESTNAWHWTVMTGQGGYGYVGQFQRRAKASSSWPSTWTEFVDFAAGDGRENVERYVSFPSADFDRDNYDYRIRVMYQVHPELEPTAISPWTVSATLEGFEPTAPAVALSESGPNLVCSWTEAASGAHLYRVRWRKRNHGTEHWGNWSPLISFSAGEPRAFTVSSDSDFRLFDWECGVRTRLGATDSSESVSAYLGSTLGPPTSVEIMDIGSQLQASWPPVLGARAYQYRSSSRWADDTAWDAWSSWSVTDTNQATVSFNVPFYGIRDWRVDVRAHNGSFQSPATRAEWEGRDPMAPSPPLNVRIERQRNSGRSNAALIGYWNAPDDGSAKYYDVRSRRRTADMTDWPEFGKTYFATDLQYALPAADSAEVENNVWEIQVRSIGERNLKSQWIASMYPRPDAPAATSASARTEPEETPEEPEEEESSEKEDTCGGFSSGGYGVQIQPTYGLGSGVQCGSLDAGGVGNQSVIDAGVYASVDLWGYVAQGVEVCFEGKGSLTFLDASASPRAVSHIGHYIRDGMTCAKLDKQGTVVLGPLRAGDSPAPAHVRSQHQKPPSECMVRTNFNVNLRDAPAGNWLALVYEDSTLTGLACVNGWFQVDFLGVVGWLSADYVTPVGNCV